MDKSSDLFINKLKLIKKFFIKLKKSKIFNFIRMKYNRKYKQKFIFIDNIKYNKFEIRVKTIAEIIFKPFSFKKKKFSPIKFYPNAKPYEIDLYCENLSIGIECQGITHYKIEKQICFDMFKKRQLNILGIKLIYIPLLIENKVISNEKIIELFKQARSSFIKE